MMLKRMMHYLKRLSPHTERPSQLPIEMQYTIGPYCLRLPSDHKLPEYQAHWKRYDRALVEIARLIDAKYPGFAAIDIGANVGDTAAAMCVHRPRPVLCVEGNPAFLQFLRDNTQRISRDIVIEESYVGQPGLSIDPSAVHLHDGTASIVPALSVQPAPNGPALRPFADILVRHPGFTDARLVKIDTDGMDFTIVAESADIWRDLKPVLLFEYDLTFSPNAVAEARGALRVLKDTGYSAFVVYDNFGNFLVSFESTAETRFEDLNVYLMSNRQNGVAVYYLDVCAFHAPDHDLFCALRSFEHGLVLE